MTYVIRSTHVFALLLICLAVFGAMPAAADDRNFGIGLHYWSAIDDLAEDGFEIDEDGLAGVLSHQYGGFIRFEAALEIFPDGFGGSSETAYSPMVFVVVGSGLYGALGVGVTFSSDFADDVSDPFYAARVGVDWDFFPKLSLDVNLNYRFDAFAELDEIESDAITLGALVRFHF